MPVCLGAPASGNKHRGIAMQAAAKTRFVQFHPLRSTLNSMCRLMMIDAYAFFFFLLLFISLCVNPADCSLDSPLQVNVRGSLSLSSSGLLSSVWPFWTSHELVSYSMTVHASPKCRENCSSMHVLSTGVAQATEADTAVHRFTAAAPILHARSKL